AVIKLQPKSQELENENEFFSFVKRAFGHRRKQLGKQLNELEGLCKQKFDVNSWEKLKSLRAENLTPDQFIELFLRGRFLE
ncbi:MAG: hypothetical protein OEL54_06665, partial [Flavobacteriaceae bacterium]|nr:hypothetical protein [Flavobacteriaceae bacterium]